MVPKRSGKWKVNERQGCTVRGLRDVPDDVERRQHRELLVVLAGQRPGVRVRRARRRRRRVRVRGRRRAAANGAGDLCPRHHPLGGGRTAVGQDRPLDAAGHARASLEESPGVARSGLVAESLAGHRLGFGRELVIENVAAWEVGVLCSVAGKGSERLLRGSGTVKEMQWIMQWMDNERQ